jgi:hypothetical protein
MPQIINDVTIQVVRVEVPCDFKYPKTNPKKWEHVASTNPKYDQTMFSKCRRYHPSRFRIRGITPAVTVARLTNENT